MTHESLIRIDREKLSAICRRARVRRLGVFGSALGPDFGAGSDLDLLVEFEPGRIPGLAFFSLQEELTTLFGRTVDLNTPAFLSPSFRDEVVQAAEILYDAG
jgi:uncharacterized protein